VAGILFERDPNIPTVFDHQREFMRACGQTVGVINVEQANLYVKLVVEEAVEELLLKAVPDAMRAIHRGDALRAIQGEGDAVDEITAVADGIADSIVVLIGLAESFGLDMEPIWLEVQRSNHDKIGPDGKVVRRADGKILKPEGWRAPELHAIVAKQIEARKTIGGSDAENRD
jgi:predicted HAD superfamily Cof-like phosphohydrolase